MAEIKFELKLPDGPKNKVVFVTGGADSDHDGTIDKNTEIASFARTGNTWTRKQVVPEPVTGTEFYVHFLVGANVRWELTITDEAGTSLYADKDVTALFWSDAAGALS